MSVMKIFLVFPFLTIVGATSIELLSVEAEAFDVLENFDAMQLISTFLHLDQSNMNISGKCKGDNLLIAEHYSKRNVDALKVFDAWGKPNPGILQGSSLVSCPGS